MRQDRTGQKVEGMPVLGETDASQAIGASGIGNCTGMGRKRQKPPDATRHEWLTEGKPRPSRQAAGRRSAAPPHWVRPVPEG
jgi:hypothetical protein